MLITRAQISAPLALDQLRRETGAIPGIVAPIFVFVILSRPEIPIFCCSGQECRSILKFVRTEARNLNPKILQDLARRMCCALLVADWLALIDAAFLATAGSTLQCVQTFFGYEHLGPAQWQMKDKFRVRTGVAESNLAVAFGIKLAPIADIQFAPAIVGIQ